MSAADVKASMGNVCDRIKGSLRGKVKPDKFDAWMADEHLLAVIEEFVRDPDISLLFVQISGDKGLQVTHTLPKAVLKKAIYFVKSQNVKNSLMVEDWQSEVVCGELTNTHLETLHLISQEVYFPLLSNTNNRDGWSGPTAKDVMLKFGNFLSNLTMTVGQSKGQTLLPHPPPEAFDEDNLPEKERIYLLENSVVQWTDKIESVLATDPVTKIKDGQFPDPLEEMDFWAAKSADLSSIHEQLQNPRMKEVLTTLTEMKSALASRFELLAQQVIVARNEATENKKYLATLKEYFQRMRDEMDFVEVQKNFFPIFHCMQLVWKHSTTYNTKERLVCLLQEICNSLIEQATKYVSGEVIFRHIEDEDVSGAMNLLRTASQVCKTFKDIFARYQVKAEAIAPGAWDINNDEVFARLNAFLERCDDILEFTKIVFEFQKLEKIFLGGTKGEQLTETIRIIFDDFRDAVEAFQNISYDIMDITKPDFDDDFYRYRCQVKELERRLSRVLTSGFDDASTIYARFALLDSFEGLLERPIIKDELDKKQSLLLQSYSEDLHAVQKLFHELKDEPRIDKNLPPVAGRLSWCRGLLNRVEEPMRKLREHIHTESQGVEGKEELEKTKEAEDVDDAEVKEAIAGREEAKEIEKVYNAITEQLRDYEAKNIENWAAEVETTSGEKLEQMLLRRSTGQSKRLVVNFDDDLVRLLREVKYFLSLNIEVTQSALAIYERAEQYRTQIGNLELIVSMYNEIVETLQSVERPLVEKDIVTVDEILAKGIDELNWKSAEVNEFISTAMVAVKDVFGTVKVMKDNFGKIKDLMNEYSKTPLADRKNKPISPSDFDENLKKLQAVRHKQIQEIQDQVSKLLLETNAALKNTNKNSPIWRAYVEYVQDEVREGLARTIVNSIKFICLQLDASNIEKNHIPPLLEIKLGLYAKDVLFNAEDVSSSSNMMDVKSTRKSSREVWQIVHDWVEDFFKIGNIMTRMDSSHYVGDLKKHENIVRKISELKKHLDWNNKECEAKRQDYLKYEFLWKNDRDAEFERFLHQSQNASVNESKDGDIHDDVEKDEDEDDDDLMDHDDDDDQVPLDLFEEKILQYKQLEREIAEKESVLQIGWLKVNAEPIKAALQLYIGKWINTFTSYLYNDVTRRLNGLEEIMMEVKEGLATEVRHGDGEGLKKVLAYIHQVRSKEKATKKMFQPLRDTVALLKKYGRNLDEYELKMLQEGQMKWETTVELVYKAKERVNTLQNEEVDKIKIKVNDFADELVTFRNDFKSRAPFSYNVTVEDAYDRIYDYHIRTGEIEEKGAKLNDLERVFELAVSKHRIVKKIRQENKNLKLVWDMISVVKHQFDYWRKTLWDKIDTDMLTSKTKAIQKQVDAMPNEVRGWQCFNGLRQEVRNLLTVLPLVNSLHSPYMQDRHWRELKVATGRQFVKDHNFCLANLLELQLHKFVTEVEYIVELASKENKIATQLKKIDSVWDGLSFEFKQHGTHKDVSLIMSPDDIMLALEENMSALQNMQGQGKYVEHFIDQVSKWQKSLGHSETVMFDWLEVQRYWSSLEAIFLGSADIKQQLPEDAARFQQIDGEFKTIMADVVKTPSVIDACAKQGRAAVLAKLKVGLALCEKSLFQYLETKRKKFPRFYFLSNSALLDILSNGQNPQLVQKHLGDCFDNVSKLKFDEDKECEEEKDEEGNVIVKYTKTATHMYSKDGDECVPLVTPYTCEGAAEDWLNNLVHVMRETLAEILSRAKFTADHWDIEKPRHEWLYDYPAQICLTASQIIWTEEVESQFEAFADGNEQALKEYLKTLVSRLETLIELVLDLGLSHEDRVKIITLITVDVHNRDVVGRLIEAKVHEAASFAWQSQMRYEWNSEKRDAMVKIADATFHYSYEYVGNTGRLVITPLTDRCYITLTQALRLIMGGAPAGPAGTGKTETTKDLGRALGLPVYVFNCSEQMNVHSMGAIYKGLAQTGAWGCFDEFNRIPIEVLSVVSTQVATILNAIRADQKEFDFMGENITLCKTVGMFITMNPGYAGRTELPENLKTLFRSCAMVVPDIELICENMLMAEGFLAATRLAKKFFTLYSLCKELLSAQMHYDWGLRACKAVLRVAGSLKRAEIKVQGKNANEDSILMRALRDFNLPKLVDDDKPIFLQLVQDMFPEFKDTERKFDFVLQETIREVAVARNLQAEDMFVLKCVELAELLDIRHSVFVIGPAGSGKSQVWRTLMDAFNKLKDKTVFEVINPKAVRNNELYGWLTKTDWHDGILSTIMRNMSRENAPFNATQKNKWLVLDGDIDPNWIESLNTVMDDNKMLTLVSNERIPLSKSMRLLFEIADLDNATPATVSRAGILYINAKDIGSRPYWESWVETRSNDKEKSSLLAAFNKYCSPEIMDEMQQVFFRVLPVTEVNLIKGLCYLLEGLLHRIEEVRQVHVRNEQKMDPAYDKELFETVFVYACIWAFGGQCPAHDKASEPRKEFSDWWKRVFTTIKFPGKNETVFDFCINFETAKFETWDHRVPDFSPTGDAALVTSQFVPTVDTVRQHALYDLLVPFGRAVLTVGNGGTGKTSLVKSYLRANENVADSTINLNFYTDAKALQLIMEGSLDKRSGKSFGPRGNKKLVYFIDDLNMPYVDEYNTQSPSALVRQQMDYGSWYDTTKLEKKDIQDVQYMAAMNPTAGSFTVNPRYQNQFIAFAAAMPKREVLKAIYGALLGHHLSVFPKAMSDVGPLLTNATLNLYDNVVNKFIPSTRKFHYQFTLRDLSLVFQGICNCSPRARYTPAMLIKLWEHEATRVFQDRLVNQADIDLFNELKRNELKKTFADYEGDLKSLIEKYIAADQPKKKKGEEEQDEVKVNAADFPPVLYGSFTNIGGAPVYLPIPNRERLKKTLQKYLESYNENNVVMNLELFGAAVEHVARIVRIIEQPNGNALLVGVGGSGKQSLARLSSSICGYDVFQISVSQSYGVNDLKTDLQDLYRKAGVKNMSISFILTDSQIVNDEWLVFINDILSSGFIPDLFNSDDLDAIFNSLRNEAKAADVAPDDPQQMMAFFLSKVRANLHLILCFSPVGEAFRKRARKFPALTTCTSIDWFHPWPRDALESVAYRFLGDMELGGDDMRKEIALHMAKSHTVANEASARYLTQERRYNYTTPKTFLELIAFYKQFLSSKRAQLAKQSGRLEKGILTLKQTHSDVAELKEQLTETLVRVSEKAEKTEQLIKKMGVERIKVEEQEAVASVEAEKSKAVAERAETLKAECENDLKAALPLLEAAKDAVACLNKSSLTTLKSFATPPPACVHVTNAVMILKKFPGKRDWANAKGKLMKNIGTFLQELVAFDATNIDDDTLAKVQPILDLPVFNVKDMESKSEAAANLCNWVINIVSYNKIYKVVAPKVAAQEQAQEEYDAASAKLRAVEEQVAKLQQKLKAVADSYKVATDEKNAVEAEAQKNRDRLSLAKRLVEGLADENTRWSKGIAEFQERGRTLVGDVLLASDFISYVGAFNQQYRKEMWEGVWLPDIEDRKIPMSEGADPLRILSSESDWAKWKNEGLASDRASLENGAIITQCTRWPLMIDPQLQGIKWIRSRMTETNNLKVVQLNQKRYLKTVVLAIQNGDAVLIESCPQEIDATLDPVLSRAIVSRGGENFVRLGADEVTFDPNFRLLLQTKLSNPHYKPEVAAQCTLVNFIVTEEGLEDQLLALVVKKEKPELENQRTALVRAINDYMVSLTDLENELLERLSNAPDDILSDEALIEGLEKTKQTSIEIGQKVELAQKKEVQINAARNEYKLVASEGSWLFFLINQLNVIDHMYQFSLNAFNGFFQKAMGKALKAEQTEERVVNLRESIRLTIFTWVVRGLFEMHKLIVSTQLCFKLMSKGALEEKFNASYFDYLIRGSKKAGENKLPEWLNQAQWNALEQLVTLDGFDKLLTDMKSSPNRFREWFNKPRPETTPLPLEWRKLDDHSPFKKLLILRALRQDRMTTALENYVRQALPNGNAYIECDAGKSFSDVLIASLEDANPVTPVFFILSPGADPVQFVETQAKKHDFYDGKFHRVALGEGQDVVAMDRLDIAHKEGHWVVLENIHLMPKWNPHLEKKLDDFANEGSHPDFRIFLSAEPSHGIPIGILERSIKLTNEPPRGLKQNLKRAFASFDRDEFEFKDSKIKSIMFGLAHFHSVIIERIKFGPKGWNRSYPFNTGDLMNSAMILSNYLESGGDKVPWNDLKYMFGEILYGGHITDDLDRLLCMTYLNYYMRDELLDEMEMFPFNGSFADDRFTSPPVLQFDDYFAYIDQELPAETPVAYGLHPNAEISVKTTQADYLFTTILELQPRSSGAGDGEGDSMQNVVSRVLMSINDQVKGVAFNLDDIASQIMDERGPFQNVFMQECERMNNLTAEMRRSLSELDLGLSGELQMSSRMEALQTALFLGRVPATWSKLAYPSRRALATWVDDLMERVDQLSTWVDDPASVPKVTNIAYFFNPQSFLTAIMQKTAQTNKLELDKLVIQTEVTRKTVEQTDSFARDGAYVTGLSLEGARWNWNLGTMEECNPREMYFDMPVITCHAVMVDRLEKTGIYRCPVYKTQQRGPTFVFTANLRSKLPQAKWILAGVVMVLEIVE